MVFNPAWSKNKTRKKPKKRTIAPKHCGVKQSSINARGGVGSFAPPSATMQKTPHGTKTTLFEGKKFSAYYEIMQPRNKTRMGYSKGEKSLQVVAGSVWLLSAPMSRGKKIKGAIEQTEVRAGKNILIPANTAFSLSTSTMAAEFMTTESSDFQSSWEKLADDAIQTAPVVNHVVPMDENGEYTLKDIPPRRNPNDSPAKKQAARLRDKRKVGKVVAAAESNRRQTYDNPNSSTVVGVNPMPVIPRDDD